MTKLRKIYNEDYYKAQLMIADSEFIKFINKLTKTFNKFNCPIPKNDLKNYEEHLKWTNKYFNRRNEIIRSKSFQDKIRKITKGKKIINSKEKNEVDKLRLKELPPVYMSNIDDLLEKYNIKRKDKNYRKFKDFIIRYIFFNRKEFIDDQLVISLKKNKRTNETELFIKIFPHTRKEDIIKFWPAIKKEQSRLPQYRIKHKKYKNFHRDLEIYNIYKSIRNKSASKYKMENTYLNKRADDETQKIISQKYGDLSWGTIRNIVNNIEKLKKSVGFKKTL